MFKPEDPKSSKDTKLFLVHQPRPAVQLQKNRQKTLTAEKLFSNELLLVSFVCFES